VFVSLFLFKHTLCLIFFRVILICFYLCFFSGDQPGGRELLLIDDLPHAAGPTQRARLARALGRMATASRFPVAVITTTGDSSAAGERFSSAALGSHHGLHKVSEELPFFNLIFYPYYSIFPRIRTSITYI
jgi:hypothetical protein